MTGGLNFYLMLFVLGGVGVLLRYGVTQWLSGVTSFPWATLFVNVLGSFLIGFLLVWTQKESQTLLWKSALAIGFLGALTTFSSFSLETLRLFESGQVSKGLINIALTNSLCILLCWLGWRWGQRVLL